MSAFVPATTPFPTRGANRAAVCQTRPTTSPFFGSAAFGMPVARAPAPARSQLRMDVTVVVGDNEPVESGKCLTLIKNPNCFRKVMGIRV